MIGSMSCAKKNKLLTLNHIKNLSPSFYIGTLNNIFFACLPELDYVLKKVRD